MSEAAGRQAFLRDEEDGLLVEVGSPEAIKAGLKRLLDNQSLRERLGGAARARILNDCSFAKRMERVRAVYDSLESS